MKYQIKYHITKDASNTIIGADTEITTFDDVGNSKQGTYSFNAHEIELIKADPANIKQIAEPKIADGIIALYNERKTTEDHTNVLLAQFTPDPQIIQNTIDAIVIDTPPQIDKVNPIKVDIIPPPIPLITEPV